MKTITSQSYLVIPRIKLSRAETLRLAGPVYRLFFNSNKHNKAMKNSFLGILVLSHVISISIVIGSEEESNDNGKFHEEAEFGIYKRSFK